MTNQKRTRVRVLGLVSLSIIIAAVTYGFAEANSIHASGLMGAGYGVDSPYQVTDISYLLDLEDPSTFSAVEFKIDQQVSSLKAGVSATEKSQIAWAEDCEFTGSSWICTFSDCVDVLKADWLHVVSAQ